MDYVITSQKGAKTYSEAWEDYCQRKLTAFYSDPTLTSATFFIPVGYIRKPFRMFSQPSFEQLEDKLRESVGNSGVELVAILATKRGNSHCRLAIKLPLYVPENIKNKPNSSILTKTNNFVHKRQGPRVLITRFTANYKDINKLKTQIKLLLTEVETQRKFMHAASYRETKKEENKGST